MSQSPREPEQLAEGTLISHLLELRTRLMRIAVSVVIVFIPLVFFANDLFTLVAKPLIDKLPEGTSLIATSVVAPFMTPLKLALVTAIFVAIPYILHQVWGFVSPGLYQREKRFAMPLLVSSILLFYAGVAFAYFILFPIIFAFFASTTPEGVMMMTDISSYLDFTLLLFFAFGLEEPRLRAARHLHRRRVPHAARRDLADVHGGAHVPALRGRHPVLEDDCEEPSSRERRGGLEGRRCRWSDPSDLRGDPRIRRIRPPAPPTCSCTATSQTLAPLARARANT